MLSYNSKVTTHTLGVLSSYNRELMMLVQRLDYFRPLFVRGQNEKAAQLSEFQIAAPL